MVHRSGIVRLDLDVCYLHSHRQPGKCQKICNNCFRRPGDNVIFQYCKVTKDLL